MTVAYGPHNSSNRPSASRYTSLAICKPSPPALASPEIGPYLNKYAGKQLLTGPEAAAYANSHVLRSDAAPWTRYLTSAGITVGAFIVFAILAAALQSAIGPARS